MAGQTNRFAWILIAMLLVPGYCLAQAKAAAADSASDQQQIKALIEQFAAPEFEQRNAALQGLEKFGVAAVPFLEQTIKQTDDPEIKSRAQIALLAITSGATATPVTLSLKDVTAQQAVAALAQAAHVPITAPHPVAARRLESTKITLDVSREPFFAALLRICEAAELRPESDDRDPPTFMLTELDGHWCREFTTIQGPFSISALSMSRKAEIVFGEAAHQVDPVILSLMVGTEPKVHAEQLAGLRITKCVDENDNPVPAQAGANAINAVARPFGANGNPGNPEGPFGAKLGPIAGQRSGQTATRSFTPVAVFLQAPAASKTVTIEGEVQIRVAQKTQRVEVPKVMSATNVPITGGVGRMVFKDCRPNDDHHWAVRIDVPGDGRDDAELQRVVARISASGPKTEDGFGRPLEAYGRPSTRETPRGMEITFVFHNSMNRGRGFPTEPATLIWEFAAGTRDYTLPFRFEKIPLPR